LTAPASPARELSGAGLLAARAAWALLFAVTLITFALSVPLGYAAYLVPCSGDACFVDQLTAEGVAALAALGLTPHFYAVSAVIMAVASVLVTSSLGLLIAWRRPRDPLALFVSITLVLLGVFINSFVEVADALGPGWALTVDIGQSLMWLAFPILLYIFPDGRLVPRWAWLPLIGWVYTQAMFYIGSLFPALIPLNPGNWPEIPALLLYTALLLSCLYALLHRFRRVSSPLQRQQTKWVVFGLVCALLVLILGGGLAQLFFPSMLVPGTLGDLIYDLIGFAALLLIPVTFAISILRYRLWDIDVLIRRTLTYTLVTAGLALAYLGAVLVLQLVFAALLGQASSTLVSVLSTLAIAALFSPLRRRVQSFIDRRFYRRKYDAAQALASLGASVRDDPDLTDLTERLVHVVDETMQPAHISLWLQEG
jgi:hypothetical protein